MERSRILLVVGARPNYVKAAALLRSFSARMELDPVLLDTGQHYDYGLSERFFHDLQIPRPEISLRVGSGTPAEQIGQTMIRFEKALPGVEPKMVVVVGDVNATVACGLVAVRHGIPLAHVEAGLRSFDRTMPEETNRVLTDHMADLLFVSEESGVENLHREGIPAERIFHVGNVMADTLFRFLPRINRSSILDKLHLTEQTYGVVTLHRPSNVDSEESLRRVLGALEALQPEVPLVFPLHPRTERRLIDVGLKDRLDSLRYVHVVVPLGYFDFLKVVHHARFVLTDSGGVQEETTILGVPCLTMRENTERPATVTLGTNEVVGTEPTGILQAWRRLRDDGPKKGSRPLLWDGEAGRRIADILAAHLAGRSVRMEEPLPDILALQDRSGKKGIEQTEQDQPRRHR